MNILASSLEIDLLLLETDWWRERVWWVNCDRWWVGAVGIYSGVQLGSTPKVRERRRACEAAAGGKTAEPKGREFRILWSAGNG